MEAKVRELIPHAPQLGLYLEPEIPSRKLERALKSYGEGVPRDDVVALYDATRLGTGGDGALFTSDRLAFQNNNLQARQVIAYRDIVGVRTRRRLLGGRYIEIDVNRGRATIPLRIDFSAKPDAAEFVSRLLHEAVTAEPHEKESEATTNAEAVRVALEELVMAGDLAPADMARMLRVLRERR